MCFESLGYDPPAYAEVRSGIASHQSTRITPHSVWIG